MINISWTPSKCGTSTDSIWDALVALYLFARVVAIWYGEITWYGVVWYGLNHLEKFFPYSEHPLLMAKNICVSHLGSWTQQISHSMPNGFQSKRIWMYNDVMQCATNHLDSCIILLGMLKVGLQLIEKHIKSKSFTIANPKLCSRGPPLKKRKFNLNRPPTASQPRT